MENRRTKSPATTNKTRKRGRPLELTPQKEKIILDAIRDGASYTLAAELSGIHYVTLNRWRNAGSYPWGAPELRDFCYKLEKAKSEGELNLIKIINKAARKGDWKAAAWQLERRNPQVWGKAVLNKPEPQICIVRKSLTEEEKLDNMQSILSEMANDN